MSRITIDDYNPKVSSELKAKMDYFYANYNFKIAYQKYMDFIQENDALEILEIKNKAKQRIKVHK